MKKSIFILVLSLVFATFSFAGAQEELLDSANIIKDMVRTNNKIPPTVLANSKAVVVIPNAKRIGFFLGGEFGDGVAVVRRDDGNWSNPFFIKLGGGSFGWQFGFEMNSILLIFNSQKSVDSLLGNSMTIGVDASISAGPLSKTFEKNSKINLSAEIFSYRKAEGLFVGVSLKGAVISHVKNKDVEYYGNGIDAKSIVGMPIREDTFAIKAFREALDKIGKE